MARPDVAKKAAYHHGDLRQQLINAALRLIAERGPEQFTMADAARMAGVSIAAPYRHFQNRDDLIDSATMAGLERVANEMKQVLAGQTRGTVQSIAALGKNYVAFAVREPEMFQLIFRKVDDEERLCPIEEAGRETYGVLLEEVALYLNKDAVDEQVLRTALPLWTFVHGMATMLINDLLRVADFEVNPDELIDQMTEQMLRQPV